MADKKLIIADGHHRYETALNYSKEHAARRRHRLNSTGNGLPQPPYPEAAVMMTFVNMDSDGLVILPTHRVVHSLGDQISADSIRRHSAPRLASISQWRRWRRAMRKATWKR